MSFLKNILHAIGSAASAVGKFFANAFTWVEKDGAKIAVALLEELKSLFSSGAVDFLAQVADGLTKSNIPTEIVADIKAQLPKILADALALEQLGTTPTEADEEAFAQQILTSFNIAPNQSKIISTVGAEIISIIRANTMPGQKFTFAVLVGDLQEAWLDYQAALNADNANV